MAVFKGSKKNDNHKGTKYNDTFYGSSGINQMSGGKGNDTYYVYSAGDRVYEYANQGTDTVNTAISYTLGAYVENLTLIGKANINGYGNDYNNIIIGNSGHNILNGGAGIDSMYGGLGNDIYYVDNAYDVVVENANQGIDTVYSSSTYTLGKNIENLTLLGTANINATGNNLNNVLIGNSGNNYLNGGLGRDTLIGGLGNDTYYLENNEDMVLESANQGTDTVVAGYSYTLGANIENLTLIGINTGDIVNINGVNAVAYGDSDYWANYLDYAQGDNTQRYYGSCGIISCENVLIQAGKLSKKIDYNPWSEYDTQESSIVGLAISRGLCTNSTNPYYSGGTTAYDQRDILASYGISSRAYVYTVEDLANAAKQGKGIIASIDAGLLWYNRASGINHAITVTGVAYNISDPNKIEGFYICDSGRGRTDDASRFISYSFMKSIFRYYGDQGWAVITNNPIKELTADINGTGNELDNIITGTSGRNILDGKSGNDTLNGVSGNDTLIGDSGNDSYLFNRGDGLDTIRDTSGQDKIVFGKDITQNSVSFLQSGNNLLIDYGLDQIIVENHFIGNSIEGFQFSDNTYLSNADINSLVQTMAAFSTDSDITLTHPDLTGNNNFQTFITDAMTA